MSACGQQEDKVTHTFCQRSTLQPAVGKKTTPEAAQGEKTLQLQVSFTGDWNNNMRPNSENLITISQHSITQPTENNKNYLSAAQKHFSESFHTLMFPPQSDSGLVSITFSFMFTSSTFWVGCLRKWDLNRLPARLCGKNHNIYEPLVQQNQVFKTAAGKRSSAISRRLSKTWETSCKFLFPNAETRVQSTTNTVQPKGSQDSDQHYNLHWIIWIIWSQQIIWSGIWYKYIKCNIYKHSF